MQDSRVQSNNFDVNDRQLVESRNDASPPVESEKARVQDDATYEINGADCFFRFLSGKRARRRGVLVVSDWKSVVNRGNF